VETGLDVSIRRKGPIFEISGGDAQVARATALLEDLANAPARIRLEDLQLAMVEHHDTATTAVAEPESVDEAHEAAAILRTRRRDLRGRTPNQRRYIAQILDHDVTFGIGPAGTGKTFLAVACAVDALERDLVQRIVLTRPAVEAGERLGFLPGDLAQKVDPYLRPLYDALYDLMGYEKAIKLAEKQIIEIAPLAYMRGRTLNHSFVILDEAQNTTPEQMKMFLTRIGFGSKAVITGDPSQVDLPKGQKSGLADARHVLEGVRGIAFTEFESRDVVRHPLVARIVEAYAQQNPT
jgi:phosphate starvation-inducible PhoH-like protein